MTSDLLFVIVFLVIPAIGWIFLILGGPPKLKFKRVGEWGALAHLPTYKTEGAAGMDIYTPWPVSLPPGEIKVVQTGLAVELPRGYELQIRPRSGLAVKGVTVVNTPGTVDEDYRGEIGVILINHGKTEVNIAGGDRIAQFVVARTATWFKPHWVDNLAETERGAGGFGSTGK